MNEPGLIHVMKVSKQDTLHSNHPELIDSKSNYPEMYILPKLVSVYKLRVVFTAEDWRKLMDLKPRVSCYKTQECNQFNLKDYLTCIVLTLYSLFR